GVKEWRAFMAKYYPDGNLADTSNVVGYTVTQTMVQVLKQCGDNLTRENVMKQAANLKDLKLSMLLPGVTIGTGPNDFAPIEAMQLSRFDGKQWDRFGGVFGK